MIEIKFNLKDTVFINELERPGTIISIWIMEKGIKYEVRYFYNGEAKEVYFYDWEIVADNIKKYILEENNER